MRLLMLGGSAFVGRAVVTDALARGWEVTTINRGTADPVPGVRALVGDRTDPDGLAALADEPHDWDVVVDTWSAAPAVVGASAHLLADRAATHAYVSSRSVYEWPTTAGADESAPLVDADPADTTGDDYARAKRGAELAVRSAFGDRVLFARAGLILGPWSNIGRLPWWLARIARGGDVLAPGPPDLPLQFIDARDLATWMLDAAAAGITGPFDIVSPSGHATMASLLASCVEVTGSDAHLHWVEPDVIEAADISPWTELPVWTPPGELHDALHGSNVARAMATGLAPRPVEDTVADTWAWMESIGGMPPGRPDRPSHGLDPAKERAMLAAAGVVD